MSIALRVQVPERDVDLALDVAAGSTLGLVGPNGAGKSTVLAALAGTLRPPHARLEVDGRVLVDTATGRWTPPHARGVGLLAQEPLLFPHLDVVANVAFGPRSRGASRAEAERIAHDRLTELGCTDLADRRPGTLSGGQQQMLAIARILRTGSKFLLLDEPTEGLAPVIVQQIGRTISALKEEGFTIVLVEQNFRFAASVADRHYVVEQGRVVDMIPNHALDENIEKLHAYLGV